MPILPECWDAVEVFCRCHWDVDIGEFGVTYKGIPASEVEHVCNLLDMPRGRRRAVSDGIQVMVRVAARLLNEEARWSARNARSQGSPQSSRSRR